MDDDRSEMDLDIDYTLPVTTHSVGITTRTPTVTYREKSNLMPDYSGILELPGSMVKSNGLRLGIPFSQDPELHRFPTQKAANLLFKSIRPQIRSKNPLIISNKHEFNNLRQDSQFQTTVTIASGNQLLINDIIGQSNDDPYNQQQAILHSHDQFKSEIINIKYRDEYQNELVVLFDKKVKFLQTNNSIDDVKPAKSNGNESNRNHCLATLSEKSGSIIRDGTMNPSIQTIFGMAIDDGSKHCIKLYDIEQSKRPYHTIPWESDDLSAHPAQIKTIRSTKRTFSSIMQIDEQTRQLDCIPSHLVNMILTTTYSIKLIDPRLDEIGLDYIVKSKSNTFYPMERIIGSTFSQMSDNQFYCISDSFLRVFDMRYPGQVVNQLNHMLDIPTMSDVNIGLLAIPLDSMESHETVCMSTCTCLSFATLEHQTQSSSLINPKSKHQPIHIPNSMVDPENQEHLFGLSLIKKANIDKNEYLFTIAQLTSSGNLVTRSFHSNPLGDVHNPTDEETTNEILIDWKKLVHDLEQKSKIQMRSDIEYRDFSEVDMQTGSGLDSDDDQSDVIGYLDVHDKEKISRLDKQMESARAREMYDKMRERINSKVT